MKVLKNCFEQIIAPENLWVAWLKYRKGKRNKVAVREFEADLENNLVSLRNDLLNGTYNHGNYYQFVVFDPKKRTISVPAVKDHLVHQAVFNILYPFFDAGFSAFSFSCRNNKGVLKAVDLFSKHLRQVSKNYHQDCWVLHGDVKKCFDSINHKILIELLEKRIVCSKTAVVLKNIIESYRVVDFTGIPLGNLTSQLFVNVYLHELDIFVKEKLGIKKYLRYADDFLLVFEDKKSAEITAEKIRVFLKDCLDLDFPADHQKIRLLRGGLEVLGRKFMPFFTFIRPKTFRRLRTKILKQTDIYKQESNGFVLNSSWQSAVGLLQYGNNQMKKAELLNAINQQIYV